MKKLLVLIFMAVLASASTASATITLTNHTAAVGSIPAGAYHQSATSGAGAYTLGSTPFSVSTNVTLIADGNLGGYNCSSKHVSGDLNFISSSVSASIKETSGTKGTAMTAIILPTGDDLYTGTAGY